jgi:2-iminobutanoate/2-iminopropanoate deaminase
MNGPSSYLAGQAAIDQVYATHFKDAPPARATVEVARLPRDMKIEISAIAVHP